MLKNPATKSSHHPPTHHALGQHHPPKWCCQMRRTARRWQACGILPPAPSPSSGRTKTHACSPARATLHNRRFRLLSGAHRPGCPPPSTRSRFQQRPDQRPTSGQDRQLELTATRQHEGAVFRAFRPLRPPPRSTPTISSPPTILAMFFAHNMNRRSDGFACWRWGSRPAFESGQDQGNGCCSNCAARCEPTS